jgi:hypothetical protein
VTEPNFYDECEARWMPFDGFNPSNLNGNIHQRKGRDIILFSMPTTDHDFLQAALIGYEQRLAEIDQKIAELRRRTGQTASAPAQAKRRTMSPAGRRKIAAAQRRRWAELKDKKALQEKPKRKMSAAARKRIGDAARKRWALVKAKQKGKPGK